MARETLLAIAESGAETRYILDVWEDGDRWTSTLAKLDAEGRPEPAAVAPRFYGLTADQARRRMLSILEGQYESVQVVRES